jgi:hypothetical protein
MLHFGEPVPINREGWGGFWYLLTCLTPAGLLIDWLNAKETTIRFNPWPDGYGHSAVLPNLHFPIPSSGLIKFTWGK